MITPRLVLFTRYPEPGHAKTRLIPKLGAFGAAELHRRLTERTLATLRKTGLPIEIWVTGAPVAAFEAWLGTDTPIWLQPSGDLGARMDQASRPSPAIVIGSDIPLLAVSHIEQAVVLLRSGKVALGPAEDGGYYLVGLPEPVPLLFADMPWSTSDVLAETIRRLSANGILYGLLPVLPDLDRPEDLERFPFLSA